MNYYDTYSIDSFRRIADLNLRLTGVSINEELLNAAIFWQTNIERQRYGLPLFQYHPKLGQMATSHSYQMRQHSFFDHENPYESQYRTLTDRLESVKNDSFHGFNCWGENIADYPTIAAGQKITITSFLGKRHLYGENGKEVLPCSYMEMAQYVVEGWMNSPGHRKNILNHEYLYLGCGCAAYSQNSNGFQFVYIKLTQNFGGTPFVPSLAYKIQQKILSVKNPHTLGIDKSKFNALHGDCRQNKSISSMKENIFFGEGESPENGQEKTLCVFLLDNSGSMSGSKIEGLNKGLQQFHQDIIESDALSQRLEVAVVSFESEVRYLQQPALGEAFTMPTLTAMGGTDMDGGIRKAIEVVADRKQYYKDHGIAYKRPWIVMITDGYADVSHIKDQVKREGSEDKDTGCHYFFQPIAIDEGSDMTILDSLATRAAFKLKNQKFSSFFQWLSKSLETIATADVGTNATLENPFDTFAVK